jgi:hypothetical protein
MAIRVRGFARLEGARFRCGGDEAKLQYEFIPPESSMQFDTKIAVVIRTDLEAWQKLNVAAFITGGIAAAFPECIGEPYQDGSGTRYLRLIVSQ